LSACLYATYDLIWIVAVLLSSPWWIVRCATSDSFRRMAGARLGSGLPRPPRPDERCRILIHGVSVGEIKAAQSLVHAIEKARPDLEVVVSATTGTGFELARRLYPGREVVRFPLDLSVVAENFLARLAPLCVVLVELEVWPSFLRQANRRGVPVAVVNGRITPRSVRRWRTLGRLLLPFERLSLVCVQDNEYARRFEELAGSRDRIVVTGNIKADALRTGPLDPGPELLRLLGARPGQRTLVAGSTHDPEERMVAEACARGASGTRLILVPRHLERVSSVEKDLASVGLKPQLLSRLRAGETSDPSRPALVDTMGELEHVYALADVVFVGGSLVAHGGQNLLEPAAQGKPVVHGPHVWNFAQEEALLAHAGASRRVEDDVGLERALVELFADEGARTRMSRAGIAAVSAQKGATEITLRALLERCFFTKTG
jgi:3-deoxy-D-manno-octulosonic-acid transferase